MDKRLNTKVQKIAPKLEDTSQNISKALVINADDEVSLEKKGTIYTLFDISGRKNLDVLLVTKVVNDVLHDAYFQSESASPIQSIEKAVLKLRDNINQLAATETGEQSMITFNINTAILWGNTLYVVQYGKTHAYLMRDGNVKPISAASEGNFSVSSGVVKDNDVVILATEEFERKFLPDKLVSLGEIQNDSLESLEAALMLKFDITKTFSTAEVVEFGSRVPVTPETQEKKPKKVRKEISRLKKKSTGGESSNKMIPIIGLVVLLAGLGLVGAYLKGREKISTNSEVIQETQVNEDAGENTANENDPEVVNEDQDRINRVSRIEPTVFYDLKITDENVQTDQIAVVDDSIVVSNLGGNTYYVSDITTPKFTQTNLALDEIKSIISYNGNLGIADGNTFEVVDLTNSTVIETYDAADLGVISKYLDFIYTLQDNTIIRYSIEDGVLTGTTWTQNDDLVGARSMAVDVSIFVLSNNDELLRFTTGEEDDFTIEGLDKGLRDAVKVVTDTDLENMYIVDAGNKRLLVLSEEGVLQKQYIPTDVALWNDMKDVAINPDETVAYVLAGDKVYEVELENTQAEVPQEEITDEAQ